MSAGHFPEERDISGVLALHRMRELGMSTSRAGKRGGIDAEINSGKDIKVKRKVPAINTDLTHQNSRRHARHFDSSCCFQHRSCYATRKDGI
jgi:hypothetical protein